MLDQNYLDAIKNFEGYSAKSRWDYAQNTNGYGTKALFAGEVIDKAEADRRFSSEIQKAADFVDKFAPNLDDGSKAALTSLTYNAGTAWTESGLGAAVANGDIDKARSIFLQYNKAGGAVLDGLVQRRLQEVAWFGGGTEAAQLGATPQAAVASAFASAGFSASAAQDVAAYVGTPTQASSTTTPVASTRTSIPIANLDSQSVLLDLILKFKSNGLSKDAGDPQAQSLAAKTTPA